VDTQQDINDSQAVVNSENKLFKWVLPIVMMALITLVWTQLTTADSASIARDTGYENDLLKHQTEITNLYANQTIISENILAICSRLAVHCNSTIPLLPNLTLK
jgi:hypothetical protein